MNSRQTLDTRRSTLRWIAIPALVVLLALLAGCRAAHAEGEQAENFWQALTEGTPYLNVRARAEIAEVGTTDLGQAYTLRTQLGYGTKPWYKTMVYVDMVNVAPVRSNLYWNMVALANGKSNIADPKVTEVNQAYMKIDGGKDWLDTKLIGGRQRIKLDDDRFIGNVGWRQNEQTYDAAYAQSSVGLDGLAVRYGYLGYIRRVFGGQDDKPGGPTTRDWESNSHIINASFSKISWIKPVVFVYLLDLDDPVKPTTPRGFSSATYGLRGTGDLKLGEKLKLTYGASYAFQTEFGDNPVAYQANYAKLDAGIGHSSLGTISGGWEMLGSDNGTAGFATPLATLHAFNGWADVFLADNGGPHGLYDFYAQVAPNLPWKLKMKLIYHHFTSVNDQTALGNEFDGSLGRSIGEHLDLLFKAAYFKSTGEAPAAAAARPDAYRIWFDITVKL